MPRDLGSEAKRYDYVGMTTLPDERVQDVLTFAFFPSQRHKDLLAVRTAPSENLIGKLTLQSIDRRASRFTRQSRQCVY